MTKRKSIPQPPIVVSLGGSIVVPAAGVIDKKFLKAFRSIILRQVRNGKRFILIVGGGKICRVYQQAARAVVRINDEDIDWLGIHATRLNAHLLRTIFRGHAHPQLITNKGKINPKIKSPIIIAAGFKPGSSTDYDAVLLAKAYKAKEIINLSNIDFVYSKDPKKYKDAKIIRAMSWKQFRKMFGETWNPGANVPFDPVASRYAEKWGMHVVITRGNNIDNLKRLLAGKKHQGTLLAH